MSLSHDPAMATSPEEELPVHSNPSTPTADDLEETDILSPPLSTLREISPLASWTVSTYKPGCGIAALLNPSTAQFWQSDGPQPHLLNVHFFKLVAIARLRVYLDLERDESYTPTRMLFLAGHSQYDVVEFAEWKAPGTQDGPRGWVEIGLERCWGRGSGGGLSDDIDGEGEGDGEGVLRCMFLQIKVLENHQNGKDTHIRGVQIWARDDRVEKRAKSRDRGKGKATRAFDEHDLWEDSDSWIEGNWGESEIR